MAGHHNLTFFNYKQQLRAKIIVLVVGHIRQVGICTVVTGGGGGGGTPTYVDYRKSGSCCVKRFQIRARLGC